MELIIEQLDSSLHNRSEFDCGVSELNAFLKLNANQNQLKNISKTNVATLKKDVSLPKLIYGYYTLSSGQIHCDQLPLTIKSKLPKHPIPIARIGRLAVDTKYRGQGVGGYLLYSALSHIVIVSKTIGTFAAVVDAKDTYAKSFYKALGFTALEDSELTLFLPVSTINLVA